MIINGGKIECSVEHITREDKLDLLISNNLKRDSKIGFIIKTDVNKSDVKTIELYVVDAGVRLQVLMRRMLYIRYRIRYYSII